MSRYNSPEFEAFEAALQTYMRWVYEQQVEDGENWMVTGWVMVCEAESMTDSQVIKYNIDHHAPFAKRIGLLEIGQKITQEQWSESE